MGGRGSSSIAAASGNAGGTPLSMQMTANVQKPTTPSGHVLADLATMNDDELHDFLIGVQKIETPDWLNTHHTQRMVYGLGMNDLPETVSHSEFQKLVANGATPIYRTVNDTTIGGITWTGHDMLDQIQYGSETYLGDGRIGDGLYFSDSFSGSKLYGYYGSKSPTIQAVLSPNARVISDTALRMKYDAFIKTHPRARRALGFAAKHSSRGWQNSYSQFALIMGYNVIKQFNTHRSDAPNGREYYYNVIDRSALIVTDKRR